MAKLNGFGILVYPVGEGYTPPFMLQEGNQTPFYCPLPGDVEQLIPRIQVRIEELKQDDPAWEGKRCENF